MANVRQNRVYDGMKNSVYIVLMRDCSFPAMLISIENLFQLKIINKSKTVNFVILVKYADNAPLSQTEQKSQVKYAIMPIHFPEGPRKGTSSIETPIVPPTHI